MRDRAGSPRGDPGEPRRGRLLVAYGLSALAWLAIAVWPGRSFVLALQRGGGPSWLNHAVLGFPGPGSAEEALEIWRGKTIAVTLALILHLGLVLWLSRRDSEAGGRGERAWRLALSAFTLAFLIYTSSVGPIQDYSLYLIMWKEVSLGHDPWFLTSSVFGQHPLNAYGPLFNLFAIGWCVSRMVPKLIFGFTYICFVAWLLDPRRRNLPRSMAGRFLTLAWLAGPYVLVEIPHYGHFEVLVGTLCIAAIQARMRDQDRRSGSFLAIGSLIKFIPIFLVPFAALDPPRIRWRLVIWAYGLIAAGLAVSTIVWGPSTFRPILFAAGRSSHHLSIYRFLNGTYSPLQFLPLSENIANWAPAFLVIGVGLALAWCERNRIPPLPAATLSMVVTALLYQTGFAQYHMVSFMLITAWVVGDPPASWRRGLLIAAMVPHFGWLGIFDAITACINIDDYGFQEWTGLVTFLLGSILIAAIVVAAPVPASRNEPKSAEQAPAPGLRSGHPHSV